MKIRINLPDGSVTELAEAEGDISQIVKTIHELGCGISEMADGDKTDMIRVRLGQRRCK